MKKIKFFGLLVALCMLMMMPLQALAATEVESGTCGETLTWTLTDDGVLTISGTGAMENFGLGGAPWYSHRTSIVEVVVEEGVTSIGSSAFRTNIIWSYNNLKKVTFPSTLTAIEEFAFSGCSALEEVVLNEGLTKVGISAFAGCSSLQTLTIPSTLSGVGTAAFTGCSALTDVYYNGTQAQWEALGIASLAEKTVHFAGFNDVVDTDWFAEAVQFVYDKGMMSGSDGYFRPNDNMTRAMMVTTLYRLSGSPEVTDYTATNLFGDVTPGEWYENAVNWAYNTGVTTGYTDADGNATRFGTDDVVTREQLAVFLQRYAKLQGYDTTDRADITGFVGYGNASEYAKEGLEWAVAVKLISGIEYDVDGETVYDLAPNGSATRAQLAMILMRFCNHYGI